MSEPLLTIAACLARLPIRLASALFASACAKAATTLLSTAVNCC